MYALTGGNPFFVTEALAAGSDGVPATVVDAVLARVRALERPVQAALEQLAVVPSRVELPLARALLGDVTVLADAEQIGVLEVRPDAVAFRHELARRAVEGNLPRSVQIELNARVLAALRDRDGVDLARIVHHAVAAGDDVAVVAHAPEAARRACAAGAQDQGAMLYRAALARRELLAPADEATLAEEDAWAEFHANHRQHGLAAAEHAVELRERLGDDGALGRALATLALQQWTNMQPDSALGSASRAVDLLRPGGDPSGPGAGGGADHRRPRPHFTRRADARYQLEQVAVPERLFPHTRRPRRPPGGGPWCAGGCAAAASLPCRGGPSPPPGRTRPA